jgi:hypothetical protein
MALSTTAGFSVAPRVSQCPPARARSSRMRRIDPLSGHALEILSHAIEYLTDELVHSGEMISANNARVDAIQLLMALNRQVYYACPEEPTFADRCRSLLRLRSV